MSRTYRFKKHKYKINHDRLLVDWDYNLALTAAIVKTEINPKSKEGKRRLAKFHSDTKRGAWITNGPGWFHNLFSQRPYRRNAKNQIRRCCRDDDFEIGLLRKPHRGYWW